MASDEGDQGRSFKVQDRRRFADTGEPRAEAVAEAAEETAAAPPPLDRVAAPEEGELGAEINFSTFVISLSAQALALLGEIPDPVQQSVHVDLEAARQVIDILGMLSEKTKGNLDSAEAPLLESILYDLRMKYVERARDR